MTKLAPARVRLVKSLVDLLLLLCVFVGSVDTYAWYNIDCRLRECCDSPYIDLDMRKLEEYSKRVYGQHLVLGIIRSHLEAHFDTNHTPRKPLVLSFHGSTGTGKNYVTSFIVESIYKNGLKSKFVHYYHVAKKFPHASKFEQYSRTLQYDIETAVKECERSIFIFDEFDHMPAGLIDQIKVYLDFHDNIEGIDYRKTMFIFLTNSGDDLINNFTIDYHKRGGQRESIKLPDLEHHIARNAQNADGGFRKSKLIDKHLVTAYVPFLPLTKKHVKMCIADELARRKIKVDDTFIQDILNELYFVNGFSESGCKRIPEKVSFSITKQRHKEL